MYAHIACGSPPRPGLGHPGQLLASRWLQRYITPQRCWIESRSGQMAGQSMASMTWSSRKCRYTAATRERALLWPGKEPRVNRTSEWSVNEGNQQISQPGTRQSRYPQLARGGLSFWCDLANLLCFICTSADETDEEWIGWYPRRWRIQTTLGT